MRNWPLTVIAVIAVILLLNYGAPFFIPLFVALLISYALSPLVDQLTRLVRVRWLAAGVVVVGMVALLGVGAWSWGDDAQAIWAKVPDAVKSISQDHAAHRAQARRPVHRGEEGRGRHRERGADRQARGARRGHRQARRAVGGFPGAGLDLAAAWVGWKGVTIALTQLTVVLFLVFFMLASGSFFRKKIVSISGERLAQRKFTTKVIDEIDAQIRRYLVVMLIANTLVGLGTWAVFAGFGLQYAGLWGFIAAILHTIPYFGPALIAAGSLVVGLVQFGDWRRARRGRLLGGGGDGRRHALRHLAREPADAHERDRVLRRAALLRLDLGTVGTAARHPHTRDGQGHLRS